MVDSERSGSAGLRADTAKTKWDRETDVIVAGFGGAGVLLIEKAPFGGGNTDYA